MRNLVLLDAMSILIEYVGLFLLVVLDFIVIVEINSHRK